MNFGVGTTYLYNSLIHLNIHPNTMYAYYPQSTLVDDYIAASMVYSLYTFTVGIKSLHNSPLSIMEKRFRFRPHVQVQPSKYQCTQSCKHANMDDQMDMYMD